MIVNSQFEGIVLLSVLGLENPVYVFVEGVTISSTIQVNVSLSAKDQPLPSTSCLKCLTV